MESFAELFEQSQAHLAKLKPGAIVTGVVVDVRSDVVTVGATVRLEDEAGEELNYTIVGSPEADPRHDRISNESPVGRALLGKRKGQTVTVKAPGGTIKYTIKAIKR